MLCSGTHLDAKARILPNVAHLPSSEDQPHKQGRKRGIISIIKGSGDQKKKPLQSSAGLTI